MCDQTEVSYLPNDIVWVKLGPVWWPGQVCKEEEIPPEIMKDLRKTPIAIVKFFHEDSFEYVKKLSNIYHYNCLKKNEFIKKGLDMMRSKNRDAPSNMKLFPEDIVAAEHLTGGNTRILEDAIFQPEEKPSYTELFSSTKKTPKKIKLESKKKLTPQKPNTPRVITHPRFIRLSSGHSTDYEARERKQEPLRAECDEVDNSQPTVYRCSDCEFTTIRLNVMVLHNKSHTRNYGTPQSASKAIKRKSTLTVKYESSIISMNNWQSEELKPITAKIPKTNGTMKVKSPKTPLCKKIAVDKNTVKRNTSTNTKELNINEPLKTSSPNIIKLKRCNISKTDEFQNSLLEDWAEYEIEQEIGEKSPQDSSDFCSQNTDDGDNVSKYSNESGKSKNKSCFDFDDTDDSIVIDQSKMKFGRKIPRLLNETKNTEIEPKNDRSAIIEQVEIAQSEFVPSQTILDNKSIPCRTVLDNPIKPQYLNENGDETSNLQEIGVDNEIEIDTEEFSVEETSENIQKSTTLECNQRQNELKEQDIEVAQLNEKVDKLLEEISVPSKLPEIPRSHKKAHLKTYCDSIASQNIKEENDVEKYTESSESVQDEIHLNGESGSEITTADSKTLENSLPSEDLNKIETEIQIEEKLENIEMTSVPSSARENSESNKIVDTHASDESKMSYFKETAIISEHNGIVQTEDIKITEQENVVIEDAPLEIINNDDMIEKKSILTAEGNIVSQKTETIPTTPLKNVQRTPIKFSTTAKLKPINTSQFLKSGQKTIILCPNTSKSNINKGNATNAANILVSSQQLQSSPIRVISTQSSISGDDHTKTILKMASGKNIVCNLTPSQRVVVASGTSSKFVQLGATNQVFVLNRKPSSSVTVPKISTTQSSSKVLASNILTKSSLKNTSIAKRGKNVVVSRPVQVVMQPQSNKTSQLILTNLISTTSADAAAGSATIQTVEAISTQSSEPLSLLPTQSQQPEIMYVTGEDGKSYEVVNTTSSNPLNVSVDFNYIVDAAGNLINIPDVGSGQEPCESASSTVTLRDKDILAKALENTDGLQTEMALSDASQSAMDSCSVAQNTAVVYKTETMFENLTLNTPPIMSTYETPSRALDSTTLSEMPNEMIIIRGSAENKEYLA
ncbi:hypothetical protein PGB90_001720 [Kerria lacca]